MNDYQPSRHEYRRHGPDLFFPIFLITAGLVWLMINAGRIPVENLYRLTPYWPVLLIAGGVSVLLRRISWLLSALVWMGVAALALYAIIDPSTFQAQGSILQASAPEIQHKAFNEPLSDAKSASIKIGGSIFPVQLNSAAPAGQLFNADISYTGSLHYDSSGSGSQRSISLKEDFNKAPWNLPLTLSSANQYKWQIALSPNVLTSLEYSASTGSAVLDLKAMQLEKLTVEGGTGSMEIALPEDSPSYAFKLDASTGSTQISAPSGAVFNLTVNGGTGSISIDVPEDTGVQVEVQDKGIGSVNIPSSYQQVKSGNDQYEGTWQNAAYAGTKSPITIVIKGGIGSIEVK